MDARCQGLPVKIEVSVTVRRTMVDSSRCSCWCIFKDKVAMPNIDSVDFWAVY